MVALYASPLKGVDATVIQARNEVHATEDVVRRVVVYLSFHITYYRLNTPDIVVLSAFATSEDAGSVSVGDTSEPNGKLCGVVCEQQIASVGAESLQGVDCFR